MRESRRTKPVISKRGRFDARIVAGLRMATSLFTGIVLVTMAHAITGGGQWALSSAAALLAGMTAFAEVWYGGAAARREERAIRHRLLQAVFSSASLPRNESEEFDAGRLVALHTDNVERVTEYRQVYFGSTLAAMTVPFLTLAYVAVGIDLLLGMEIMLLCPLIPVFLFIFMRLFRKTSARSRHERAVLADRYLDAIRNLVPIRLFGAGPRIEARLREQGERNRSAIMKLLAGNQIVIIIVDGLFSLILICCTAALTIARFRASAIDMSEALTVMFLTVLLVEPLVQVAGFFYIGMGGMASERAIARYLASCGPQRAFDAVQTEAGTDGAIVIKNLSFDYGRGTVLSKINLVVPTGGRVAIFGRSGAGKSTLLGLLRGSLPMQTGGVSIGGQQLSDLAPAEIRALTATVSQRTWLFTGTVADNLRIAKPLATDEEMWRALRQAHVADELVIGLHGDIGEQGNLISGGQAQRISLARAFLSGRKILLLDEPTSQVDIDSEAHIIAALEALGPEWTLLLVTHRRASLRLADEIWQLSDGILTKGIG